MERGHGVREDGGGEAQDFVGDGTGLDENFLFANEVAEKRVLVE